MNSAAAPAKLNLFLHITSRRSDGYHELQTAFQLLDWCDEVGIEVTDDGRIERVDGPALEQEAVMRAQRQLQHLASALELRFRARVVDDPLHRMDINHFRPLDPACVALMDELPCVPDYARADRFAFWQGQLDIAAGELQSPWGATYPLEISNGRDASVAPPFSLALRVLTPWGTLLQVRAVEPGA